MNHRSLLLAVAALAAAGCIDFDETSYCSGHAEICDPAVTRISPDFGPLVGGIELTFEGNDFEPGTTVEIGGKRAVVLSTEPRKLTVTAPAGTLGPQEVKVKVSATQEVKIPNGFTYYESPSVSTVVPNQGAPKGGRQITITGSQFAPDTVVTVGGKKLNSQAIINGTTITGTVPANNLGAAEVRITTGIGVATRPGGFTYVPAWTSVNTGLNGGRASAVLLHPTVSNTAWVATTGGALYRTSDAGVTWTEQGAGVLELYAIYSPVPLAFDPVSNTLYTCAGSLYSSTDGGTTWKKQLIPDGTIATTLAVDLATHDVYVASYLKSYRLPSGSNTLIDISAGLPTETTAPTPSMLAVASSGVYRGTSDGLYRFTSGGSSWSRVAFAGANVYAVAVRPGSPDVLYASVAGGGIQRSDNSGATWVRDGNLAEGSTLAVDSTTGKVFAEVFGGVSGNTGGGGAWEPQAGFSGNLDSVTRLSAAKGQLYVGTEKGLYVNTVGSGTFTSRNGFAGQSVHSILINRNSPSQVVAFSNTGVFQTANSGDSWSQIATTGPMANVYHYSATQDPSAPGVFYAATSSGVYRSGDGGGSWSLTGHTGYVSEVRVAPSNSAILYLASDQRLLTSGDTGATWTDLHLPEEPDTLSINQIAISHQFSDRLYAMKAKRLYHKASAGAGWVGLALPPGIPDYIYFNAIAVDPTNADLVYMGIGDGTLRKSVDAGRTWTTVNLGSVFCGIKPNGIQIDKNDPRSIYALCFDGVIHTTNGGSSWVKFGNEPIGNPSGQLTSVAQVPGDANTLYLGVHGRGLFKTTVGGL